MRGRRRRERVRVVQLLRGSGVRVGAGGRMRRGRVQRQCVLQLQQLVVWVERRRRAVSALVRSAHHVAAVREPPHVGRRVVVCIARAHDALVTLGSLRVHVGETAGREPRRAVPLFAPVGQVVLQPECVATVKQQTTFTRADKTSCEKRYQLLTLTLNNQIP